MTTLYISITVYKNAVTCKQYNTMGNKPKFEEFGISDPELALKELLDWRVNVRTQNDVMIKVINKIHLNKVKKEL